MKAILVLSIMVVALTVGAGVYIYRNGTDRLRIKNLKACLGSNLALFIPLMMTAIGIMIPDIAHAADAGVGSGEGLGMIGAALSTGLACVGAGYAVGSIGASAIGAVSEDPKVLGKTLIFVGLGEGIAIYGLIISIMIIGRF